MLKAFRYLSQYLAIAAIIASAQLFVPHFIPFANVHLQLLSISAGVAFTQDGVVLR